MQLATKPLLGFLIDPLFRRPRVLDLKDDGIAVQGGTRSWVGFVGLTAAPAVTRGLLSSTLHLPVIGEKDVRLTAAGKGAARAFAAEAEDAWRRFNVQRFDAERQRIDRILAALAGLEDPNRYQNLQVRVTTGSRPNHADDAALRFLDRRGFGSVQSSRALPSSARLTHGHSRRSASRDVP